MAIVVIIKNEGEYIREWLDFHIKIGVDHFYIYNNDSDDNTYEILKSYIDNGYVTLTTIRGRAQQLPAYNDALKRFRHEAEYIAFIDADEFLMPEDESSCLYNEIKSILALDRRAAGIAVNWRMYGSSHHETKPEGGLIKNFLYRAKDNGTGMGCIKTIVNPRAVAYFDHVHYPRSVRFYHSINEEGKVVKSWYNTCCATKELRINHYFTKSKEEWIKRRSLGKVDHSTDKTNRTLAEFYSHDNNDIFDDLALRIVRK